MTSQPVISPPDLTVCEATPETLQRVGVRLRASLQCWRCGTGEAPLTISGELDGPFGPLPLFVCPPCGRVLDDLYRAAFGKQQKEAPR